MTHPTTAELIAELEAANAKRTQGEWDYRWGYMKCGVNDGTHKDWKPPETLQRGKCSMCSSEDDLVRTYTDEDGRSFHVHRYPTDNWRNISGEDGTKITGNYDDEEGGVASKIEDADFICITANRMALILARLRRLEEVEAIVAKLDKTIDGVPYFDGDTVWHPKLGECVVKYDVLPGCGGAWGFIAWSESAGDSAQPMDCYSTEAAARAAGAKP